jgi:hypothetical protein
MAAFHADRPSVAADLAHQFSSLSDRVRHIAFAGVACVWAFRQEGPFGTALTIQLAIAAFFLVCALGTDLLEAALRIVVTARGGSLSAVEVDAGGGWKNWKNLLRGSPERVLLMLKLGFVVMAYAWILAHLYNMIILL